METVHKTLDILETFLKRDGEIGIAELASLSGVNISTVYRVATDLVKRGYLKQKQRRGKYLIGTKLLEFNRVIQRNLKVGDLALTHLEKISKQSGESVNLGILDNFEILTISEVATEQALRISSPVGERMPLHASSIGKIFLAYMEPGKRKIFYESNKLHPRTEKTITDSKFLEKELEKVRKAGISIDDEEFDMGVWAVSAPIFDCQNDVVASLAIVVPSVRVHNNNYKEFIELVRQGARDISQEMGYKS